MFLFVDGFENFDITDIGRKWDSYSYSTTSGEHAIVKNEERKGNRCLYGKYQSFALEKTIKKSRTVYFGIALKTPNGIKSSKSWFEVSFWSGTLRVGTCSVTLSTNAITFTWNFGTISISNYAPSSTSGITSQSISMDTSKNPTSGFMYYQFGITVNGTAENDEDCTSWVENRVSGSNDNGLKDNIRVAAWEGSNSYWIDKVRVALNWTTSHGSYESERMPFYIKDAYICNSEGQKNNGFMGDVRIRPMMPNNVGSINNASMIGFEGMRNLGVGCDFVNTVDAVPAEWDYDQYPDLIEYANPFDIYLRMSENNQQLFTFTQPDYAGAEPDIYGVVATVLCRAHEDLGKHARLELLRKHNFDAVQVSESRPDRKPIGYYDDWECHTLSLDNTEELVGTQQSEVWIPSVVSADQWGFKLVPWDGDPTDYLTGFLRLQQTHDEIIYEYLDIPDFVHRHWDREIVETIVFTDYTSNSWAHYLFETIDMLETLSCYRRFHKGLNETLYAVDSLPWYYLYLKEVLGFDDEMVFTYGGTISETLGAKDYSYHEWVEELTSNLYAYSSRTCVYDILNIFDSFSLTEPLVWDNHETLEDSVGILESYLWTNHEAVIDYLTYESYSFAGWGEPIEDGFGVEDEHFNGHWVEQIEDGMKAWFEGITQQWRYEWFIGVIISSTRIAPIEDTGQWGGDGLDGDKTGYNSW